MKLFSAAALVLAASNVSAFAPSTGMRTANSALSMSTSNSEEDRRSFVTKSATGVAATALATSTTFGAPLVVNAAASKQWRQIKVPFEDTVYDIDFDSPTHGYIVGARGSFAETNDGGLTWEPRSFSNLDAEEEITYRFQTVSFENGEGWVLGKPTLLLHTKDGGKSWERIPLSPKLPGEPTGILATGPNSAEMITSSGAVYTTENAGRNWKAQVKETIDATLNRVSSSGVSGASYFTGSIVNEQRDSKGAYLAVSSRGNFFLTWEPGQDFWIPHNRGTSRRIQNMGFVRGDIKNGLWMTLNGGKLLVTDSSVDLTSEEFLFNEANIKTGGYGITDVAWRTENEVWAVGGSNTMFVSKDNGKTFSFDKSANDIPGNLYNVKFLESGGWALGSSGLLLKFEG
mmetsp:Transcript_25649/g.38756  ORF Transcript_25649/g.38756 Transcript_25649/m.38756 type:complete len:401 (+) Transcript_25649:15-1217(+)|eukprot:scaffold23744_cov143-Skeletonema_dohrnii-CCMP3373.AAC.1